ncbi:hypothetical protein BDN70DRAFT_492538 [Pholiota conissans]|uniref:F-box domain-containing protein n=1 Tax=Pholiota conissans TaxID=109636 RepID=A0A9P5Z9K9_9AGAR|nr:hypothetical protein BDN70DRAFT_492538 [Pholiota conissans]
MIPVFPQEIYDEIIGYLKDDPRTLKATALTCRSFVHVSQKHRFSRVVVRPSFPFSVSLPYEFVCINACYNPPVARLKKLLDNSPHIGCYIEELELLLCRDRHHWDGWTPFLEFCLPRISKLQTLSVRAELTGFKSVNDYVIGPPEDSDGVDRIMKAFKNALQLPSFRCLQAYRFDISPLLSHCRHLKELKLSIPEEPATSDDNSVDSDLIFQNSLRLEIPEESDFRDGLIRDMLLDQGVSLAKLEKFSRIDPGRNDAYPIMDELCDIFEECSETLQSLELKIRIADEELEILKQRRVELPSLRVLHVHLCCGSFMWISPKNEANGIIALTDLCCSHDTRTSQLECLMFNAENVGWECEHFGNLIVEILSDRVRFPKFKKLSWYFGCHLSNAHSLACLIFTNGDVTLPFEMEFKVGLSWKVTIKPFIALRDQIKRR